MGKPKVTAKPETATPVKGKPKPPATKTPPKARAKKK